MWFVPGEFKLENSQEDYQGTNYPMIHSAVRQHALGEFLRKHRELVTKPADDKQVGERRRRTSGLRREEVAQMAGISSTWYTRLEQGKEVTPSGAALGRIADVLRLAPAERAYLFQVARRVDPNGPSNFAGELASLARQLRAASFPLHTQPVCSTNIGHRCSGMRNWWSCSLYG